MHDFTSLFFKIKTLGNKYSSSESWNCHADHVTLLYLILRRLVLDLVFLYTTEVMTSVRSPSFSSKRIKLEDEDLTPTHDNSEGVEPNQDDLENSCSICLHSIADRTVIPKCSHEFCFECLLVWTGMSSIFY